MEPQNTCLECGRLWVDLGRAIEFSHRASARFAVAASEADPETLQFLEKQLRNANERQVAAQIALNEHKARHIGRRADT